MVMVGTWAQIAGAKLCLKGIQYHLGVDTPGEYYPTYTMAIYQQEARQQVHKAEPGVLKTLLEKRASSRIEDSATVCTR